MPSKRSHSAFHGIQGLSNLSEPSQAPERGAEQATPSCWMHTEPGPWGPELIGQSRGCSLHVLFMGIRPVKFPQLTEIVTSPLLCAAHGRDLDKWVSARPPPPAHPGGCSSDRGWLGSLPTNPQNSALTCPSASHEHRRSCPTQPASAACSCPQRERPVRKDPRELHRKSPKHRRSAGHPPTPPFREWRMSGAASPAPR